MSKVNQPLIQTVFTKEQSNHNFTQQYVMVTVNDLFALLGTTRNTLLNRWSWQIKTSMTKLVWCCHTWRLLIVFYRNQMSKVNQSLIQTVFTKEQPNINFTQQYMSVIVNDLFALLGITRNILKRFLRVKKIGWAALQTKRILGVKKYGEIIYSVNITLY